MDNLEKPRFARHLGLLIKSHRSSFRKGTSLLGGSDIVALQLPTAGLALAACTKHAHVFTLLQFNGRAGSVRTTSGR